MKIILAAIIALLPITATSEDKTACYSIKGMTCAACSVTIKISIKKLNGIKSIDVFSDRREAQVKFDTNSVESSTIAKTISRTGYEATEKACN